MRKPPSLRLRCAPVTTPDVDGAARFLAGNARVLDRRRFERLFSGGEARPVRDGVAAFRNSDGGFGQALEPDGRTPASQPAAIALALDTLDGADAWDEELVAGACEWLAANAPAEGGASFVEPTVEGWPHAPWWEAEEGQPASLYTTGESQRLCMRDVSSIRGSAVPRTCFGGGSTIS